MDTLEARVRELERPAQLQPEHSLALSQHPSTTSGAPWQQNDGHDTRRSLLPMEIEAESSTLLFKGRRQKQYGKSSSLHFALNIEASAVAMSEGSHREGNFPSQNDHVDDDEPKEEWLLDATGQSPEISQLLPHPPLTKTLLDKYFEAIHPLWPFLLEQESRDHFVHPWTLDEPPDSLWMVQLNLIMCLGCQ